MDDHAIRELLVEVGAGRLARRSFVQIMAGLGLVGPLATHLLATVGGAQAEGRALSTPAKRGGGGHFKALWWNAPNLLNPLLAVGLKDRNASAVFYEKLVAFNPVGDMVPVLAQEVPTVQNGGVAKDGTNPYERPRGPERHGHPDRPSSRGRCRLESAARNRAQRLRRGFLESRLLVPGGVAQTRLVHVTRRSPARREAGSRSYPGQTR